MFSFFILPQLVSAATLYLDPAMGEFGNGNIKAQVKIDTDEDECINAGEITVKFPKETMTLKDFATGDALFNLWIEKPATADMPAINQAGAITFSGGIPGGYCGKIPGDPGESNILGSLVFSAKNDFAGGDRTAELAFGDNTNLYLNDGLGTLAKLALKGASYKLSDAATSSSVDWQKELKNDKIPPEPFVVELRKDAAVHDGRYFIMFSTTDKQTGIDRYEIIELTIEEAAKEKQPATFLEKILDLLRRKKDSKKWQKGETPYLLQDQSLKSIIRVRAIDKAGNERLVEYTPKEENMNYKVSGMKFSEKYLYYLLAAIAIAIAIATAVILRFKQKKG